MQDMETLLKRMTGALEALEKADGDRVSSDDLKLLAERNQLLEDTLTETISAVSGYIQSVNDILQMNQSLQGEGHGDNNEGGDAGGGAKQSATPLFPGRKRAVGE